MHLISKQLTVVGLLTVAISSSPVMAAGNLAAGGDKLPELKIDSTQLKFSQNEYDIETGKYYRLTISVNDGSDTFGLVMPQLLRNSWLDRVAVDAVNIHASAIDSFDLDGGATLEIAFVVLRPGVYDFWSPGYEKRGLKGKFVVK